jgi:DNA polymerase-1
MPRVKEHKWEAFADDTVGRYNRDKPQLLAVDTETTGLTWPDTPFGMSVSWHGPERIESGWFELESDYGNHYAEYILGEHASRGNRQVYFLAKFDIRMLYNYGVLPHYEGFDYIDVMPAVALLKPIGEHKLKVAAREYLGANTYEEAAVKKARKELGLTQEDGYWPLPREVVVPYAMKDTEYTLRLHDMLLPLIEQRGLEEAFGKEQRIVREFLRMEMRGLKVNPEKVKENIKVSDGIIHGAKTCIEEIVGRKVGKAKKKIKVENGMSTKTPGRKLYKTIEVPDDFNPGSPKQLLAVFAERGHKLTSTEGKVLEKLDDPLVTPLLAMRDDEKLRNTYLAPLLKEMDENGIVHPNLNSNGTATGRASSGAVKDG